MIELSTTAAQIYKRLQRTPRLMKRVCCLVSAGPVSAEIPEKCYTVNVSRRGACIEIRQSVKQGQMITLEKVDSRKCAHGRVTWIKETILDRYLVGVEILEEEDFWGLGGVANKHEGQAVGKRR